MSQPLSTPTEPPKFQRVFHLNAGNLAPYDTFTFPTLLQRWQVQPQRGELVGISASVAGAMAAFAIAETLPDRAAELISLFVAPDHRRQGIANRLLAYLERALMGEGCRQVAAVYTATDPTAGAFESLLRKRGWQDPVLLAEGKRRALRWLDSSTVRAGPAGHPLTAPPSSASPRVSLVMTVYNTEAHLAEALNSVLAQTFHDWELILWDDGSTDGSVAVAQAYARAEARVRFHAGTRRGRVHALCEAHALTRGEYVGWLDADDVLASTAVHETLDFLDRHPDVGMVYTDHVELDHRGLELGLGHRCRIPYSPRRLLVDLVTFHFRLLRQSVFAAIGGFNPEFACAEDYDLCLRVSEAVPIHHLERPLYFYRLNPRGISQQDRDLQRWYSERAVNDALRRRGLAQSLRLQVDEVTGNFHLRRRDRLEPAGLADAARAQFQRGRRLARQGDRQAAVTCFREALQLQPNYLAAWHCLGKALQELGQFEGAIAAYQHLLAINPDVAETHCNLGAIWQLQGQTERAIAAYRRAIHLKPDLAAARLNLAQTLAGPGQA